MFILTLGQEAESNQPSTTAPADVVKTEEVLPVDDDVPSIPVDELTQNTSATFDLTGHMASIEEQVKREFKDAPIMAEIAYCESRYRQYSDHGVVLTGIVNNSDVGVFQINTYYHGNDAERLGYNLDTVEGNIGYGRHLYETQGVQPWVHSSPCWNTENKYIVYK